MHIELIILLLYKNMKQNIVIVILLLAIVSLGGYYFLDKKTDLERNDKQVAFEEYDDSENKKVGIDDNKIEIGELFNSIKKGDSIYCKGGVYSYSSDYQEPYQEMESFIKDYGKTHKDVSKTLDTGTITHSLVRDGNWYLWGSGGKGSVVYNSNSDYSEQDGIIKDIIEMVEAGEVQIDCIKTEINDSVFEIPNDIDFNENNANNL
jgi:hypothetical protein